MPLWPYTRVTSHMFLLLTVLQYIFLSYGCDYLPFFLLLCVEASKTNTGIQNKENLPVNRIVSALNSCLWEQRA